MLAWAAILALAFFAAALAPLQLGVLSFDKAAHVIGMGALALLLRGRMSGRVLFALLAAFAISIEAAQAAFTARSASLSDLGASLVGVALGLWLPRERRLLALAVLLAAGFLFQFVHGAVQTHVAGWPPG